MKGDWAQVAARLEPSAFRRYLRTRGWQEEESRGGKLLRFTRTVKEGTIEVEIPSTSAFADYARRIREAVEILALVEDVSLSEMTASLAMPNVDIVRFRFTGEASASGMIPLDDALRMRHARKQLLLATAHSEVEPRPHFPRLARAEPALFLAQCREAPPESGSYVSPVLVPVSPAVGREELEAPFARRVTERLARALSIVMDALAGC